jgi:hypothetical protein
MAPSRFAFGDAAGEDVCGSECGATGYASSGRRVLTDVFCLQCFAGR